MTSDQDGLEVEQYKIGTLDGWLMEEGLDWGEREGNQP